MCEGVHALSGRETERKISKRLCFRVETLPVTSGELVKRFPSVRTSLCSSHRVQVTVIILRPSAEDPDLPFPAVSLLSLSKGLCIAEILLSEY